MSAFFSITIHHLYPRMINRTACSVAFFGHYDLYNLSKVLYDMDFGKYGPTKCRRGWWDDLKNPSDMQIVMRLFDKIDCLTVLREPFALVESYYNYFMFPVTNLSLAVYLRGNRSAVRTLFGSMKELPLFNLQSERFFYLPSDEIFKRCTVGIHEAYNKFTSHISGLFPPLKRYKSTHTNNNPYKNNKMVLPFKYMHEIAKKVSVDGKLWAQARSHFYRYSNISCNGIRWGTAGEFSLTNSTSNCDCGEPSLCNSGLLIDSS